MLLQREFSRGYDDQGRRSAFQTSPQQFDPELDRSHRTFERANLTHARSIRHDGIRLGESYRSRVAEVWSVQRIEGLESQLQPRRFHLRQYEVLEERQVRIPLPWV